MNRIDQIFQTLRNVEPAGKALCPYITVGDPDVATSAALLPALESAGASIAELGIPFSDPIADGPVIQASMSYALDHGVKVGAVLEAVAGVRAQTELGLMAMVSYSVVHRMGVSAFVKDAVAAGIDGFIFPDLPIEESTPAVDAVRDAGGVLSMLISPTTPDDRAAKIAEACSGFVYVLSRAGITGERKTMPVELPDRLRRLREVTDLPMAVGFGIANADHVREVVSVADAAIVGTAVVRRVVEHRDAGQDAVVEAVSGYVRELAGGLTSSTAVH